MLDALYIPSPSDGVWNLGPVPIRGYALCIILGIVVAVWISERRWAARGGKVGDIQDVAIWAVPFGLVGARLYHVATDWEKYFGEDGEGPIGVLYVWQGGLGIWGGVGLGVLGVWIACRVKGLKFLPVVDTIAPTVLVAHAIGRWGNWFNQELYGRPTDLPWALEIHRYNADGDDVFPRSWEQSLLDSGQPIPDVATFHPTFLYECLWNLAAFALIVWLGRRWRDTPRALGYGRGMALYVMLYTVGRGWIEYLRIDDVQLADVFGLRFNVWTSIVLFVLALGYFLWSLRAHPGIEESVYVDGSDERRRTTDGEAAPVSLEKTAASGRVAAEKGTGGPDVTDATTERPGTASTDPQG